MDNGYIDSSFKRVLDFLIESLLLVLLLFSPLAFGVRAAWSEEVVIVLSAAMVISFLIKFVCYSDVRLSWTWAYLPAVILFIIVIFQVISFPTGLIRFISPHTAELKSELLQDLPASQTFLQSMSISFYPYQTIHDLRLLISIFFVFIVVVNVYTDPARIKRLLKTIVFIGGGIALIALAQNIFSNGKIYWFIHAPTDDRSGPFYNHNHFGQYMNLSIGAAIGWISIKVHEDFAGRKPELSTVVNYLMSPLAKSLWLFVLITGLCIAAVFVSLTRGGIISMVTAGSFVLLLLFKNKKISGHGWIMAVIALLAFNCVLLIGFDAVYERLSTLKDFSGYAYRWQTIKDLMVSFKWFPFLGTGFGSHAVIYPMFQNIPSTLLFTHAENEYLQLLEECGIVGLLAFVVFITFIILNFSEIIHSGKAAHHFSVYGLGFGLLAILIHSLSDYGQHIPANAFLSAISCGLLLVLNKELPGIRCLKIKTLRINSFRLRAFILVCFVSVFVWTLKGADDARVAGSYWEKAKKTEQGLVAKSWKGTPQEYDALIACTTSALQHQPQNKDYLYCLGVYHWYAITKANISGLGGVVNSEEKRADIDNIIDLFNRARMSCPSYGPVYCMLGMIEKFVVHNDRGAEKIRKGLSLAPNDPIACFMAARLDIAEGKNDDALPKLEKAVYLEKHLFKNVVDIYVHYLNRPESAIAVAGDDYDRLDYILPVLEDMQYEDLVKQTREKMKDILERKIMEPDASAESFAHLAALYNHDGDIKQAIQYYQQALGLEYSQVSWRLALARLLAATHQIQDAIDQTRICLRIKPQSKEAEKLLKELSVSPQVISEERVDSNNTEWVLGS